MSYGKPEKICPREHRGYRRFLKRAATRRRRRLERRDPENAPRKNAYFGWSV